MTRHIYSMSDYTFTRPGLPPMDVTGELRSDQPLLHLDRAIAHLHGAAEALVQENQLCIVGSVRKKEIVDLLSKVRKIKETIEAFP